MDGQTAELAHVSQPQSRVPSLLPSAGDKIVESGSSSLVPAGPSQQIQGVTIGQGDLVQAGRDAIVNHHHHYHTYAQPTVDQGVLGALRHVPNLRGTHLDILSKAAPKTVLWFLKSETFVPWVDLDGDSTILWGTGPPGAGKSVMTAIVIDDLERRAAAADGKICVAYIYFRYSDSANLTVRAVLEILVKQTVERHANCELLADEVYSHHMRERTQPTEAQLLQLLNRFTQTTEGTFYVLEALDEAPEKIRIALLKQLATLNARLFITSRPLKNVEARIPGVQSFSIVAQDSDLKTYIALEIGNSVGLQNLLAEGDSLSEDEVVAAIKDNCGGVFLHASLQLNAIFQCDSINDVIETLSTFPSDVRDVYHQTWNRICGQSTKDLLLAKAVLTWVLSASRSMTVEELRHAISAHPDTHKFDRKRMVPEATAITACCGLVTVEEETRLVRLVHYTAKETLQHLLHESHVHPHSLLATVCITHLAGCGFQDTTISSQEEFTTALQSDPLLAYAVDGWYIHVRESLDVEFRNQAAAFIAAIHAFPALFDYTFTETFDTFSPLHILAYYQLPFDLIPRENLTDPNLVTGREAIPPLHLTAWSGNVIMAQELLRMQELQVNTPDKDGFSALMVAAFAGNEAIVELLLSHPETDVNFVDGDGRSALAYAVFHEGTIKLLLSHPKTQVGLIDHKGWSALIFAAYAGSTGGVILLLAHPEVQVNLVDHEGRSALISAAGKGHQKIVELLLAHPSIQVNLVQNKEWTALVFAVIQGHVGIVKCLLAHPEIDVGWVGSDGHTILMFAAMKGYEDIVQLLLAHPSIQVNLANQLGWTALMFAAAKGYKGIVRLLLAFPGIQVNHADVEGHSALVYATYQGHKGIVGLLLAHVATEKLSRWPALIPAARKGYEGIVKLLDRPKRREGIDR